MLKQRTKTFCLISSNLIAIVIVVILADSLGLWDLIDLQDWLGVKMKGPSEAWYYFGVAILIVGPMAAVPLFLKRFYQKYRCPACGEYHSQHF
jgi:hypothetical protein